MFHIHSSSHKKAPGVSARSLQEYWLYFLQPIPEVCEHYDSRAPGVGTQEEWLAPTANLQAGDEDRPERTRGPSLAVPHRNQR